MQAGGPTGEMHGRQTFHRDDQQQPPTVPPACQHQGRHHQQQDDHHGVLQHPRRPGGRSGSEHMTEEITRRMLKEQVDAGRDQKDGQACNSVQHPATVPGIMEPMKPFRRPGQETEGHEIPVVAGETE